MSASPAAPLTEPSACRSHRRQPDTVPGTWEDAHTPRRARCASAPCRDAPCARRPLARHSIPLEIDAVQLIEQRLMREGIAERVVAPALRHAEVDAHGVIVRFPGGLAAKSPPRSFHSEREGESQSPQPGIGINNGAFGRAGDPPHTAATASYGAANFRGCPETIKAEPLQQLGGFICATSRRKTSPSGTTKKSNRILPCG
jgi:hypothetical protein